MSDDAPTPLNLDGVGWYEVTHPTAATTLLAYVHEDGSVYFPETNDGQVEFALAAARGHVHRLVRADDAEAEVERLRAEVRLAQAVAQGFKDALADTYRPHIEQNRAYEVAIKAYGAEVELLRAVVREHPPVKPDREAVIERLAARWWDLNTGDTALWESLTPDEREAVVDNENLGPLADAMLDLWPGRSEAEVRAEGVQAAVDELRTHVSIALAATTPDTPLPGRVQGLQRALEIVGRLAAEGGDDRG